MEELARKSRRQPGKKSTLRNILIGLGILIYLAGVFIVLGLLLFKVVIPELKPISVNEVKKSVVMVIGYDQNNRKISQGSGFCFKEKNEIITNFHVISGADRLEIKTDAGNIYKIARIRVFDKVNDLALLEGTFALKPLKTISTYSLNKSDKITTISSPGGVFNKISTGSVIDVYKDTTEMKVSIRPGSSGGAVINKNGRVIGVIVANINPDKNLSLAINIDIAENLYKKFKEKDYGVVTDKPEDINSFLPNIFDNKDGNELVITNTWTKNKLNIYQPASMDTFNKLTSYYSIFNTIMAEKNDGFSKIYNSFSSKKKKIAVEYYEYLKSYDKWWFSDQNKEFDETKNLRKDNPKDWTDEQLLLDLGVLERYQLAILGARVEGLIYIEDFDAVVKTLPLADSQKSIILLSLGGQKPVVLGNARNAAVKAFVSQALANDSAKIPEVLKRLGY